MSEVNYYYDTSKVKSREIRDFSRREPAGRAYQTNPFECALSGAGAKIDRFG
jgi:hypothetical protein